MKNNYKGNENEEEFTNILLDDSLLEEEIETIHINELHNSINPKLIPKEINNIVSNVPLKTKESSHSVDNLVLSAF
jgi:hypothetical protein